MLADECGPAFREFDIGDDYLSYVDGRRRYDGVASFLEVRAIDLPAGTPEDSPDERTIVGLGNRKDGYFLRSLAVDGVRAFDDAVALLGAAPSAGQSLAVVSASRNCDAVLTRVGLLDRFDVRGPRARRRLRGRCAASQRRTPS